jgi:hypothetical protein
VIGDKGACAANSPGHQNFEFERHAGGAGSQAARKRRGPADLVRYAPAGSWTG